MRHVESSMQEPAHTTSARSTATSASEGRLKVDAGKRRKRRKTLRRLIKY